MAEERPPERGGHAPPLAPLIHGRVRLLILCLLANRRGAITFSDLKRALELTDGTLSVHLGKLADGGLVEIHKEFVGRKPQTKIRMSAEGRRRFRLYVEQLRDLVPGLSR